MAPLTLTIPSGKAPPHSSAQDLLDQAASDQLASPMPCTAWDLRALLNHFIDLSFIDLNRAALSAGFAAGVLAGADPWTAFADSA